MTGLLEFEPATLLLAVLSALGLLGGIGMGIKALIERKSLDATAKETTAKAGNEEATAASIVAAAARELVDPLRKELAIEREESAADVARERAKVRLLQAELDRANQDAAALRATLHEALLEIEATKERLAKREQEIVLLEHEIARLREARWLNREDREYDGLDSEDPNP